MVDRRLHRAFLSMFSLSEQVERSRELCDGAISVPTRKALDDREIITQSQNMVVSSYELLERMEASGIFQDVAYKRLG
jgi:hypothetical protein